MRHGTGRLARFCCVRVRPPRLIPAVSGFYCFWRVRPGRLRHVRVQREIYDGEARLSWVLAGAGRYWGNHVHPLRGILRYFRRPALRSAVLISGDDA